jgi:hypothetical protein
MFNDMLFKNPLSADTTRVRQPKKDKMNRINQTQSVDLNNDDLNVSKEEIKILGWRLRAVAFPKHKSLTGSSSDEIVERMFFHN